MRKPYYLSSEMLWKPDPNVDAARKLPKWQRFFRACGEKHVSFDNPVKAGRGYKIVAFTSERNDLGGWASFFAAEGTGATVLAALQDAYAKAGFDIPEATALLAAGLQGDAAPEKKPAPPPVEDDFDSLIEGDSFEDLL